MTRSITIPRRMGERAAPAGRGHRRRVVRTRSGIRRGAARARLARQDVVPQMVAENTPAASVGSPEFSLEDPLVRSTRAELHQLVGQRVQLFIATNAVPAIAPWDADGTIIEVGDSLVVVRPGHGPNAGLHVRFSLHSVLGFIPLTGLDPKVPRWQAVPDYESAGQDGTAPELGGPA